MLTATYCVALCGLAAGWWKWRGSLERVPLVSRLRRALLGAYWALAATMLGSTVASLTVAADHLSPFQLRILVGLVIVTVPQAALFAFVLTPVAMGWRRRNSSFLRALLVTGCGIVIPSVLVAGVLLWVLANPERVAGAFSH